MKYFKHLTVITLLLASMTFLSACEDNNAEEAGETVDEVMTDTGNAIEDACEDVKEGVEAKDTDC